MVLRQDLSAKVEAEATLNRRTEEAAQAASRLSARAARDIGDGGRGNAWGRWGRGGGGGDGRSAGRGGRGRGGAIDERPQVGLGGVVRACREAALWVGAFKENNPPARTVYLFFSLTRGCSKQQKDT